MTLSAPGTEAFKQDFAKWDDLRRQATRALEGVESSLSKRLQDKEAKDRLAAGVDDKAPAQVPEAGRQLLQGAGVEEETRLMQFAHPLPWWAVPLVVAGIGALAFLEYRRPLAPLSRARRGVLAGARALTLAALVVFLLRPMALVPPSTHARRVVPVLVDVSRSMRLDDADHQARLARADRARAGPRSCRRSRGASSPRSTASAIG